MITGADLPLPVFGMKMRSLVGLSANDEDSSKDSFLQVSVAKVSGLETLKVAKKWFIKISIYNDILLRTRGPYH